MCNFAPNQVSLLMEEMKEAFFPSFISRSKRHNWYVILPMCILNQYVFPEGFFYLLMSNWTFHAWNEMAILRKCQCIILFQKFKGFFWRRIFSQILIWCTGSSSSWEVYFDSIWTNDVGFFFVTKFLSLCLWHCNSH